MAKKKGVTKEQASVCLTPKCDGKPKTRGLCAQCYLEAQAMVKSRKTTWEGLIDLGFALHSRRESTRPKLFTAAVQEAMRAKHPIGRQDELPVDQPADQVEEPALVDPPVAPVVAEAPVDPPPVVEEPAPAQPKAPVLPWKVKPNVAPGGSKPK